MTPTRVNVSPPAPAVTSPLMPTTAFILMSAMVVAGLLRSTIPRIPGGSASASTFRPTDSAVTGLTAAAIGSCMRSVSVQNTSSLNVS